MADPDKISAAALITEGPIRGALLTYTQKVDDQLFVVLEVMPPVGAGLRHLTVQLAPVKAREIANKILALTGGQGGTNGA